MARNSSEIEKRLWEAADELRANSKLKSSEYSVPVLGLIFLRYADQKFGQGDKEGLRLAKDFLAPRAKSKNSWYVPHPRKAGRLEKLRKRALPGEFHKYRRGTLKKETGIALEGVSTSFRRAWQLRDEAASLPSPARSARTCIRRPPRS